MTSNIAGRPSSVPRNRAGRKCRVTSGLALALGMTLSGTGVAIATPAQAATTQNGAVGTSESEANEALDTLARSFARAVKDQGMRSEIQDSVAERFDGDENVLWETLKDEPGVRSTLEEAVAPEGNARGSNDPSASLDNLVSKIPRFQIAVPEKFDSWDAANYIPLVAYFPQGVEDTTLKTITAYDADGTAFELDAQKPPSRPVIVLGENERTNDSGALLASQSTASLDDSTFSAAAASYSADITYVGLIKDHEPWALGSAEISMKAKGVDCKGLDYFEPDWPKLDNDGDVWSGKINLGKTTCDVGIAWWEDDGNASDVALEVGGYKLGISLDEDDDMIGKKVFKHSLFKGTSDNTHSWAGLQQHTN